MKDTRPSAGKKRGIFLSEKTSGESVPLYLKGLRPKAAVARGLFICALLMIAQPAMAETGTASWYSVASCKREGTWQKYGGKMANGEVFNDENYTCASWDYPFGTLLKVTAIPSSGKMGKRNGKVYDNSKSVMVLVTDRGPAKRLYRMGRIIDLSRAAFAAIADLKQGVIEVRVERRAI